MWSEPRCVLSSVQEKGRLTMDSDWSEKNKKMQALISKEATFAEGIKLLLEMRAEIFEQITSIIKTFPPVAF